MATKSRDENVHQIISASMDSGIPQNIEPDLQIAVKGMEPETARRLGNAVASVLNALVESDKDLDFRRMHQIIVTSDFAGELTELSKRTASGQPITYTNEEYAMAVAKVLLLPRGEGVEILPVFNARVLLPLIENPPSDDSRWMLHVLHHEFCHVHDDNKKLDAFPDIILRRSYSGMECYTLPLAEMAWDEYAANRRSSGTATEMSISAMVNSFADAIERTKPAVDKAIIAYRTHGMVDRLLREFLEHGQFLPKTAAYVLGYMDGLEKPLEALSPNAATKLSGSYFEPTWQEMHSALQEMWKLYPDRWKQFSVYDGLCQVVANYYSAMGLILSKREGDRTYVDVPFRRETSPWLL